MYIILLQLVIVHILHAMIITVGSDSGSFSHDSQFIHEIKIDSTINVRGVYLGFYYDTSLIRVDSIVKNPVFSGFMDYKNENSYSEGRFVIVSVKRASGASTANGTLLSVYGRTKDKDGTLYYVPNSNRVCLINEQNLAIPATFDIPGIPVTGSINAENSSGPAPVIMGIYPNPGKDDLQIMISNMQGNGLLKIFTINGRLVQKQNIFAGSVIRCHAGGLTSGKYIALVENAGQKLCKGLVLKK